MNLYLQCDVDANWDDVAEEDEVGDGVVDDVGRQVGSFSEIPGSRVVIWEVEAVAILQGQAETNLGQQERQVGDEAEVDGSLHAGELVGVDLGVLGHLGVGAGVGHHPQDVLGVP